MRIDDSREGFITRIHDQTAGESGINLSEVCRVQEHWHEIVYEDRSVVDVDLIVGIARPDRIQQFTIPVSGENGEERVGRDYRVGEDHAVFGLTVDEQLIAAIRTV